MPLDDAVERTRGAPERSVASPRIGSGRSMNAAGRIEDARGPLATGLQRIGVGGLLAVCAALVLGVGIAAAPEWALLGLASDDAFYYFKIAESIRSGGGSSFDGIAPTNGYHPLWMICAVAVYALGGADPLVPAAALVWLGGLLGLCTVIGAYRLVERSIAPGCGWVAVALLLLPHALGAMLNGLETSLALLTTLGVAAFVARSGVLDPRGTPRDAAVLGALLALAFLARLDSVFLAFAAGGLALLGAAPWATVLIRCCAMGGTFCALAAPYLALNLWSFGALMPISGGVKSSLPQIRESLALEGDSAFGLALLLVSWGALIPVVAQDLRARGVGAVLGSPLVLLGLACTGHFLHLYLWMTWGVYWWHFAVYGLWMALAVPAALARIATAERVRRLAVVCAVALALLALPLQVGQIQNRHERHALWRDAASWARRNTEPDAVFALKDAGLFSFFSERRVVNLDGKANGLRYRDYLARGQVESYLSEVGVRYVADINGSCADDGRCAILILRGRGPGVYLNLPASRTVYRSEAYPVRFDEMAEDRAEPRFMIWRFGPGGDLP